MTYQLTISTIRRIPYKTFIRNGCNTPLRNFTTNPNRPIIISRQYKEELLSKIPKKEPLKPTQKIPDSEKPWPIGWQIFGYTMLVMTIPASIATYIVEDYSIRDYLLENTTYGKDIINFLRTNFGPRILFLPELKPCESYIETKEEHYFDYFNDIPAISKAEEGITDLLNSSNFRVEVMINDGLSLCYVLKGSIQMNLESLKDALHVGTILEGEDGDVRIAVDFLDDDEEELVSSSEVIEQEMESNKPENEIRKVSSAFSTWHHFSKVDPTTVTNEMLSEKEMKISKLEYRQEELTMMLNDKDCTASVDELMNELKDVRRELYRLKGKWIRWGWASLF